MSYDPDLCARLIAIVESGLQYGELKPYADQLEAARAEVERLTGCMNVAGLQCFMRGGAPEQVADHMRRVVSSWIENETKLTAERDDLRRTVGRMRPVLDAAQALKRRCGAILDFIAGGDELDDALDAYRAARNKEGQ